MQTKPNGDFLLKTGEIVTVTVTASDTDYVAGISLLSHASWTVISPPHVPPGSLKEVRKFAMIAALDSFDISFVFVSGTAPAKYHVNITGSNGGSFDDDISNPNSSIPPGEDYTFVTS